MPVAQPRDLCCLKCAAQLAADELYGQTGFKAIAGLCSIKQLFSIRKAEVAQIVSDMCGQKSASTISGNARGVNISNVGVPLIRPEKARGLAQWRQFIIMDAVGSPIKARLVPYFKRRKWRAVTDENPYRK